MNKLLNTILEFREEQNKNKKRETRDNEAYLKMVSIILKLLGKKLKEL